MNDPDARPIFETGINTPEVQSLVKMTDTISDQYFGFVVTDDKGYRDAAEDLKIIKEQRDMIETRRLAITRPMDAAKKSVMDFFRPVADRLDDAERHVKKALTDYKAEQERIAQEEARKRQEAADREAKRLRDEARKADELAAKKERERLAREQEKADARAKEEADRIAEEKAAADTEEAKRRAEEQEQAAKDRADREQEELHQQRLASEAEQRERTARAETLEQRAEDKTAAPVVAAPKVKGISTRKKWLFEITDETKVPREYMTIDKTKIGGVVRALKNAANIPGVRVYSEDVMSARK